MDKKIKLPVPQIIVFTTFVSFLFLFGNLASGVNRPNLSFYAKDALGISVETLGILFFLLHTSSGVIRVPVGILIDRYGTRKFLTIAFGLSAISLSASVVFVNWLALAIAMILSGTASGMMFSSQKFRLAYYTDTSNRSAAYSMLFFFQHFAGFVGPFISGVLMENYGFSVPMICGLAFIMVGMFLSLRLPQIRGKDNSKEDTITNSSTTSSRQDKKGILSNLKQMGRDVWLITLFKTSFISIAGVTSFIYAFYFRETFSLSYELTGIILTVLSLPRIAGILSAGRVRSIKGRKKLLLLTALDVPLFIIGFRLVSGIIQAAVLITIITLIQGLTIPSMDAILADSARSSLVGLSFGIYDMFMRIGIGMGSVLGGFIALHFGYVAALSTAGLMAIISSCLALIIIKTKSVPQ